MAITFALRGDSFTPRVNGTGGPDYGLYGSVADPAVASDGTAIGGSSLDFSTATTISIHRAHYNGVGNFPSTRATSGLFRVSFDSLSATYLGLFFCGAGGRYGNNGAASISLGVNSTNIRIRVGDPTGFNGINSATIAHGGLSANTWYDIAYNWTGDDTTDGFELFLDGSSLGTTTSSRSWSDPREDVHRDLTIGVEYNNDLSFHKYNEIVFWDEIIDFASNVTLESGSGALNGASRTSFVEAPASDGSATGGGGGIPRLGGVGFNQ